MRRRVKRASQPWVLVLIEPQTRRTREVIVYAASAEEAAAKLPDKLPGMVPNTHVLETFWRVLRVMPALPEQASAVVDNRRASGA